MIRTMVRHSLILGLAVSALAASALAAVEQAITVANANRLMAPLLILVVTKHNGQTTDTTVIFASRPEQEGALKTGLPSNVKPQDML